VGYTVLFSEGQMLVKCISTQ